MLPITNSTMATLEEVSSPLFHFPWPFPDNVDEGLFMLSQHHNNAPADHAVNGEDHGATSIPKKRKHVVMKVPSKRGGKKDRHSKICTAQGLRDRRIRLSLKVARKFFDLQDMLGFDKASKTIEWLFINSKDATLQLPQAASISEESRVEPEAKEKRKRREPCNKVATTHLARKRRDKARARARERTKQKQMMRGHFYSHEMNSSLLEGSVAVIEELWGMTRSSSSSSSFSYNSPDFAAASTSLGNAQEQNMPNAMLIGPVDNGALAEIPQQLSKTLVHIKF